MRTTFLSLAIALLAAHVRAQEIAEIVAPDAQPGDQFGSALSLAGDTLLVGASNDDDIDANTGAVYFFTGSGASWNSGTKLYAGDAYRGDFFGNAVALSGDTAVVGAYKDDHVNNTNTDQGSAYVLVRSGATWSQQAKLVASDAANTDYFGSAVAIDGDTLVVSAPFDDDLGTQSGSAYVFVRSGTSWTQQAKLLASDGNVRDLFGTSVALSGDTVVVGTYQHDNAGLACGAAYVFVRSGSTWTEQAKLVPGDAQENDAFGRSVAVLGDTLVAASLLDDDLGLDSGSVYVFTRAAGVWSERAKLNAGDEEALDGFGRSVALVGGTVVVGAFGRSDAAMGTGAAYVFAGDGATWSQWGKLVAAETAEADHFGTCVAASGAVAVVGSAWDDDAGGNSGSCHAYWIHPALSTYCTSQTTSSGCVPAMSATGTASASASSGFLVKATQVESNQFGVLFFGTDGPKSTPFHGGYMCVKAPFQRLSVQNAGATGGPPCLGEIVRDFAANGVCASVGAGSTVWVQCWFRDPPSPSTTGLTNGLEFAVGP